MLGRESEGGGMAAGSYNTVSKWFHWVTVGLMAVALPMGFVIKYIKDSDKMPFYAIHELAGLTILLVALARLAWRLTHKPPPLPDERPDADAPRGRREPLAALRRADPAAGPRLHRHQRPGLPAAGRDRLSRLHRPAEVHGSEQGAGGCGAVGAHRRRHLHRACCWRSTSPPRSSTRRSAATAPCCGSCSSCGPGLERAPRRADTPPP